MRHRNNDVEYNYRQDSDFYYLTGFQRAGGGGGADPRTRCGPSTCCSCASAIHDARSGIGKRAGPAGAIEQYGADDAFPIADIDEILPGLLERRVRVFYTMGLNQEFDQRVIGWVNTLRAQARSGTAAAAGVRGARSRAARHAPV